MRNSSIIIAGKAYDIGHPVRTYNDEGGFSAYLPHNSRDISVVHPTHPAKHMERARFRYRNRRCMGRDRSLSRLQAVCRQIVVHLDGCPDAKACFEVLHNQRGLSAHFLCDNDGTVYQTLDPLECAFHAGVVNEISVGIELQNRGDAGRSPNYYAKRKLPPRDTVTCRVHGHQILAYDFSKAQYEGMIKLCRVLASVLRIPLTSPRASNGELLWTVMGGVRRFTGVVGHYHLTKNKWDPGPFDFLRLFRGIGSSVGFPLSAPPERAESATQAQRDQRFAREAKRYYESSERDAPARFPLGPLGRSRLWHTGVHLPTKEEGKPVYAPIAGRIVLARLGAPCPIGSCNFLLLQHRFEDERRSFEFYSLYYHLQREDAQWGQAQPPWMARNPAAMRELEAGRTAFLDDAVDMGELIGRVGLAGPRGERRAQIHFAIFSPDELGKHLDPGYWDLIEGGRTSRFCRDRALIERIDCPAAGKPRDGLLSRQELRNFFSFDPKREEFRGLVVRCRVEWTPGDWASQLLHAPDFAKLPLAQRKLLIAQQIEPTLWWTRGAAKHAGLPVDGYVYSYHPLTFLAWYRGLLAKRATARAAALGSAKNWQGKFAPAHMTVDSESSEDMAEQEDVIVPAKGKKLTLEDLVDGYPD